MIDNTNEQPESMSKNEITDMKPAALDAIFKLAENSILIEEDEKFKPDSEQQALLDTLAYNFTKNKKEKFPEPLDYISLSPADQKIIKRAFVNILAEGDDLDAQVLKFFRKKNFDSSLDTTSKKIIVAQRNPMSEQ